MRERRQALTPHIRRQAALNATENALKLEELAQAHSIAVYLANGGEIDTQPLVEHCLALKKCLYLPCITESGLLEFRQYDSDSELAQNRYGILEPLADKPSIDPAKLDIVFMPLLGFDERGCRLGMGGGYYDRTFSAKNSEPKDGPLLIGYAYELQRLKSLPSDPWDVKIDAVITEENRYRF